MSLLDIYLVWQSICLCTHKHRIANKALNPFGADNLLQLEKDYIQVGNLSEAHSIESEISLMAPNSPIAVAAKKELDK